MQILEITLAVTCTKCIKLFGGCGSKAYRKSVYLHAVSSCYRNKDLKNPRKKHRVKFAQATVRRKGQVQGVRPSQGAGYGGEETGIKARVAKSVRLG